MEYQEPTMIVITFLEDVVRTSYVIEDDFGEFYE